MTHGTATIRVARVRESAIPVIVEGCLTFGILFAVLAFGGTEPVSFAIVEVLFFAAAALLVLKPALALDSVLRRASLIPLALLGVILLQLCPLPHFLSATQTGRLSISPYDSRGGLLIALTCVIGFFLAQIVSRERESKRRFVVFLAGLGVFEAFYGLAQYLTGWQKIFAYTKKYDLEEATGTYINRNHFAGFLELVLPFAAALLLYEYAKLRGSRSNPFHRRRSVFAQQGLQRVVFWLGVSILLFAALFFSRSRMGIIGAVSSLFVVFSLARISRHGRKAGIVLAASFAALTIALAIWIGAGPIAGRFEQLGPEYAASSGSRVSIWRDTVALIRHHPFLGTGYATFPVAFTPYQTSFLGQFVNHAHNDYLELASDLGIPAAALLLAAVLAVLARSVRFAALAREGFDRTVAIACAGSIVAILVHSLADFNLYIPANALLFSVVLGLAVALPSANSQCQRAQRES